MPADLPEAEPQAATALIAHLRDRPEDAKKSPSELASQFGLSTHFVRSVLASAGPVTTRRDGPHFHLVVDLSGLRKFVKSLLASFDRASAEPMEFVAWTTLVCVTFCAALSLVSSHVRAPGFHLKTISEAATGAALLITFLLHMICYFRRGMMRYSLQGGLFVWVVVAITLLVTTYHSQPQSPSISLLKTQLVIILVTMVIGVIYDSLGALVTVLGGWLRMRIEERHDEQLTRQELLERYFELQERLEKSEGLLSDEPVWSHWRLVRSFRRRPIAFAALVGFCASLPMACLATMSSYQSSGIDTPSMFLFQMLQGTFTLLLIPVYIFVGFFSRGFRGAFLNTVISRLAALCTMGLPILLKADPQRDWFIVNTVIVIPLGLIAQVGAKMQATTIRSENLRQNDPAAIVAEMLRIQWRLSDHRTIVCVLSVDAAKSSEMKAHADPLAVEYSFREYQEWIESICATFGGKVHSTAGDGAVVAFRDCRQAFLAAKRLQTDLGRFNQEDNRLPTPFKLRIGLHVGQVAGDLNEVVFTEVIDIAAHVQAAAPVSGIAVTDAVATELEDQEFIPLAKTVDGHGVSLALNPVED